MPLVRCRNMLLPARTQLLATPAGLPSHFRVDRSKYPFKLCQMTIAKRESTRWLAIIDQVASKRAAAEGMTLEQYRRAQAGYQASETSAKNADVPARPSPVQTGHSGSKSARSADPRDQTTSNTIEHAGMIWNNRACHEYSVELGTDLVFSVNPPYPEYQQPSYPTTERERDVLLS